MASSSLISSQEEEESTSLIRSSLIDFILQHTNEDDNNRLSVINTLDEIILSYVVTVVKDSLENPNCPLDVGEFSEMLSAYFPQFGDIPPNLVLKWVEQVHLLLSHPNGCKENGLEGRGQDSAFERVVTDLISQTAVGKSEVNEGNFPIEDVEEIKGGRLSLSEDVGGGGSSSGQIDLLREMFPCVKKDELIGVLTLSGGDVEKAVQLLLLEEHESLPIPKHCNGIVGGAKRVQRTSTSSEDDDQKFLKERVVARYGFVDKNEDAKEFKPILPKEEPKKLVRYREGQVVSTKGERYTEVAVTSTGEEVKIRSYISKAQQLRMQQQHNH